MGAGYSVINNDLSVNEYRMQKIYEYYSNPSSYNIWKTQLEKYKVKKQSNTANTEPNILTSKQ